MLESLKPEVQPPEVAGDGTQPRRGLASRASSDARVPIQGAAAAERLVRRARATGVDLLDRALDDESLPDPPGCRNLPRAIARLLNPTIAAPILLAHLKNAEDGMSRFRMLVALKRLRSFDPTLALDGPTLAAVAEDTDPPGAAQPGLADHGRGRRRGRAETKDAGANADRRAAQGQGSARALGDCSACSGCSIRAKTERIQRGLVKGDAKLVRRAVS